MTQNPVGLALLFAPMFLAGGGDGVHWGVIVPAAGGAVVAVATVVLVVITARQVKLTREALEATRDAVKAAQGEAEATAASVKVAQEQLGVSAKLAEEAVRARVDQQAPRVVVRQIERDPHVWESTGGGDPNTADRGELLMFRVPAKNDQRLFVRVDLHLRNEGSQSAWVSCADIDLPANCNVRAFFVEFGSRDKRQDAPIFLGARSDLDNSGITHTNIEGWVLRVEIECPLGSWLAGSPVEAVLNLRAVDSYEPGVEDTTGDRVRRVALRDGCQRRRPGGGAARSNGPGTPAAPGRLRGHAFPAPLFVGVATVSPPLLPVPLAPLFVPMLPALPTAEALDAGAAELVAEGGPRRDPAGLRRRPGPLRGLVRRARPGPIPAPAQRLVNYVAYLGGQAKAPASIDRALAAILSAHRLAGAPRPDTKAARAAIRALRQRRASAGVGVKATAATVADLRRLVATVDPGTLIGVRDRAIILLGFAGMLRRSEIAALVVGDVAESDEGLTVAVRRSKTDREAVGAVVAIPFGSHELTCPVRAVAAWRGAGASWAGHCFAGSIDTAGCSAR